MLMDSSTLFPSLPIDMSFKPFLKRTRRWLQRRQTTAFTLKHFIRGQDENGLYIIDVSSDEAVSKIKRLAMKVEIDERDKLLQETDWTEFPSVPMTDERREKWRAYRQALRDLPNQEYEMFDDFRPRRLEFPEKP